MKADLFIIFENAQFIEKDFHHRNRIRNNSVEGYKWLTVPVEKKRLPINEIQIDNSRLQKNKTWNKHHHKTIKDYYFKAPYYYAHRDFLDSLYDKTWHSLLNLNMSIIYHLIETFDIKTPLIMSSNLNCIKREYKNRVPKPNTYEPQIEEARYQKGLRATQRIIDMCKEVGGDTYISGSGGKNYLVESFFKEEGIGLEYQCFRHPVYRQCFSPFIPNLSSLDYIMNVDVSRMDWFENSAMEKPIVIH